jgi:hypothetical protein
MGSAFQYLFNDLTLKQSIAKLWDRKGEIWSDVGEAIDKSPWYAKLPLMHASGVVGAGAYSGGVLATGAVLSHPVETTQFIRGLSSGMPTGSTATSTIETRGFATRNMIDMVLK